MALAAGMTLKDNLVLLREIGHGAMGTVFVAQNRSLGSEVAVKVLRSAGADSHTATRFAQEARSVARIDSPHVVKIFDYGVTAEGEPFFVMELLRGEDLRAHIERSGPLALDATATLLQQACSALSRAHELGIVHRDVKPANIFLQDVGGGLFVKLLDFGVAKQLHGDDMGMTSTGMMMGTPYYMSPEQFTTPRDVDARSDLWSMAVVVYACLTGTLPFLGETAGAITVAVHRGDFAAPSTVRPGLPASVDAWFARALRPRREERFASARELADAFTAAVQGAGAVAPAGAPGRTHAGAAPAPTYSGQAAMPAQTHAGAAPVPTYSGQAAMPAQTHAGAAPVPAYSGQAAMPAPTHAGAAPVPAYSGQAAMPAQTHAGAAAPSPYSGQIAAPAPGQAWGAQPYSNPPQPQAPASQPMMASPPGSAPGGAPGMFGAVPAGAPPAGPAAHGAWAPAAVPPPGAPMAPRRSAAIWTVPLALLLLAGVSAAFFLGRSSADDASPGGASASPVSASPSAPGVVSGGPSASTSSAGSPKPAFAGPRPPAAQTSPAPGNTAPAASGNAPAPAVSTPAPAASAPASASGTTTSSSTQTLLKTGITCAKGKVNCVPCCPMGDILGPYPACECFFVKK